MDTIYVKSDFHRDTIHIALVGVVGVESMHGRRH